MLRFRQVHLDFHTAETIPSVGRTFDAGDFQRSLQEACVDSITVFSKCHHGWSYHPTTVGELHPGLKFDLLKAQIEACHAIGVRAPVYLSAGLDERMAVRRGEWQRRAKDGKQTWTASAIEAGYHMMCMNTTYLDLLCSQIEEVVKTYDADGIFLDIVGVNPCWCTTCVAQMRREGKDPRDDAVAAELARRVYLNYVARTNAAVHKHKPGLMVFHNSSHVHRGDRELVHANPKHLELESLPTGGWGYDHFPLSAAYARTLGMPFLGMTGKFHESWGEFGGFKHPNALRLECARGLALGARLSVGDQLHPSGAMDPATYRIIGAAYREVAAREAWADGAVHRAEVAVLSTEAALRDLDLKHDGSCDTGAVRTLLEGHYQFAVVDTETPLAGFKVVILPDEVRLSPALAGKLQAYVAAGGRILATGTSARAVGDDALLLDFGCRDAGAAGFDPDYVRPVEPLEPWGTASFVVYGAGRRLTATGGTVIASRDEPYFNRDLLHFCSHRHTPSSGIDGGPVIISGPAGILCAHPLFAIYARRGQQAVRDLLLRCLDRLVGRKLVDCAVPTQCLVTTTRQDAQRRDVVHLVYAPTIKRGEGIEVIEDLVPLTAVAVSVARSARPSTVKQQPEGTSLPFTYAAGRVAFTVPTVHPHAMVELAD
jgi:hypothetical protein